MNTFTTQIKLDRTPLILQGIDEFLGKLVKITITEITPGKNNKVKNENLLNFPVYNCGGKVSDFNREELYGSRL